MEKDARFWRKEALKNMWLAARLEEENNELLRNIKNIDRKRKKAQEALR